MTRRITNKRELVEVMSECKKRFEAESWAERRRMRTEGVHAMAGPRDLLLYASKGATNVDGHLLGAHYTIRPAFHPDPSPRPPFFQALIERVENAITSRFRR